MNHVYASGASFIEYLQSKLGSYLWYFEIVNYVSNPNFMLNYYMPVISIFDSVFAAQLTWCMAAGNWSNAVIKWWLLEDRPYWWVKMTHYYRNDSERPRLLQNSQTCETGPGCPSGHSESMAIFLMLTLCWWTHFIHDLKSPNTSWKWFWYPLCIVTMSSVMLARMIIGAHFPHQVILGALLGALLGPFLCIHVTDPYIFEYGHWKVTPTFYIVASVISVVISIITYLSMIYFGLDPHWTLILAQRWCLDPGGVHVSTTPMYALAHSTGHLVGWAICVTPQVATYRYYTLERYVVVSVVLNLILGYFIEIIHSKFPKEPLVFYTLLFLLGVVKVPIILRGIPYLAKYCYIHAKKRGMHRVGAINYSHIQPRRTH